MLKVKCDACGSPYEVDPRRIPKTGLKMRCSSCGAQVQVAHEPAAQEAPKPAAQEAPKPAAPAAPSPSPFELELDLPAPKGSAVRAPAAGVGWGDLTDLPAPSTSRAAAQAAPSRAAAQVSAAPKAPALAPALDDDFADLPAVRKPQAPSPATDSAFELELDLPAPKMPAIAPGWDLPAVAVQKKPKLGADFEFDMPVIKTQAVAQPAAAPGFAPKRPSQSFPKDSLAIDPEPLLGAQAQGSLGQLDDVNALVREAQTQARAAEALARPAQAKLAAQAEAPKPIRAGGTLPRDSLDLPQGFGGLDAGVEFVGLPFEAPAAQQASAPERPSADLRLGQPIGFDDIDLPAPVGIATKPAHTQPSAARSPHSGSMSRDSLDLPAPKGGTRPGTFPEVPEFGGDLELDLPARATAKKAPARVEARGPAAEPSRARPAAPAAADFDLDLPARAPAKKPPLAPGADFDAFALPAPVAAKKPAAGSEARGPHNATLALSVDDLELPGATSAFASEPVALTLPSLSDAPPLLGDLPDLDDMDPFGALAAPKLPAQTMELDSLLEPVAKRPGQPPPKHHGAAGGSAFGELDFGLPEEAMPVDLPVPMPMPVPVAQEASPLVAVEGSAVDDEAAVAKPKKKKKARGPSKPIPGWVWPVGLVATLLGTGVTLGLATDHGWFGVYLVEQMLPEAGDPARVAEAIRTAEQLAQSDTNAALRKSLWMLSDARNEAGLNRELLARSLLHESLYQLRFEDDINSAQRAVAILTRVMERGSDVPGLSLARAANAARTKDLSTARQLLRANGNHQDPYEALVSGELSLLEGKPDVALADFERAQKLGAGARGAFGVTRALLAQGQLEAAEAANAKTLKLSPRHAASLIFAGERALLRGELAQAKTYAKQALGHIAIDGKAVRAAKADRARAFALQGLVEERSEHPNEAQAAYEEALKLTPSKLDVLLGSGRMLMRLGRAREALTRYDSALSLKAADSQGAAKASWVEAGVGAAQALIVLDRAREALARLQELQREHPEDLNVNLWLGHAQETLELWSDAEASFQKVIALAPDTFSGYVGLSQLLFKLKRPEEASRVLASATGKVKDSAEVRRLLGNSELLRNHLPEAIQQFTSALRFDANDAGSLFGLAVAQRKSANLDAAEKALTKLGAVDPLFPGLATEHGLVRESRGDYAGAAEVYKNALAQRPQDLDLKLRLGAALVTDGRVDEADVLLREVVKERPNSAEGEYFIGRILFARHDMAQALQHFEKSVNLEPTRAEFRTYFAWSHLEHGNLSGALDQVNQALERDPNSADAHWILGRIQLRMGAVKDALESFQRTLRLKPGRSEALAGMGDAYDQLRELRKAIKAYQDAVKAVPTQGFWWYRLASLHADKGHRDEARSAYAEAVLHGDRLSDKPTWVAEAHFAYAEALREAKKTAEALDHYRTFLQVAPASHPARSEVTRTIRTLER